MFLVVESSDNTEDSRLEWLHPKVNGKLSIFFHELSQARHLHTRGIWEKTLMDWVIENKMIDKTKDFLDIGAHCGSYTIVCGPHAKRTHSFECNPQVFCYLAANVALHGLEHTTQLYQYALGDINCTLPYIKRSNDGGCNGVKRFNDVDDKRETIMVESRTLDSFNLTNVGFIKIDVEGYELEVLKGANETIIKNNYPKILFESWGLDKEERGVPARALRDELFDYISDLGYNIVQISNVTDMFLAERL